MSNTNGQANGSPALATNGNSASSQHRVASFLQNMEVGVRGDDGQINWVAPNKGAYPLSHVATFQSVVSTASKTYRDYDEAVRASLDNARFMRNDCGIMECLEGRQRGTALLNWHIEAEDDKSQEQKDLVSAMTKIMSEIPRFTEYRRVLLEAIWFGKMGIQNRYGWQNIGGNMRVLPTPKHHLDLGWKPIHGDKLIYRFDDGNLPEGAFDGQMGIRVGMSHLSGDMLKSRWKIEACDRGMAYFLSEAEQKLCTVHSHMIEDAAFEDALSSGSIHGVGVRSRIYWEWVQKQESLAFLMEYLERSAGGIELWHFPAGNSQAKEEVRKAATERLSNSRNVTLVPIPPGDEGSQYGVQIIEPGMGGIETLKDILTTYFGYRIKRYILGQVATTESEGGGGIGGAGDAMKLDTFLGIIKYDASNLEETLTRQLLRMLQQWNFPKSRHIRLKFRIDTEDEDMEKKLEAYAKAYEMGCAIKERDVMNLIGASLPGPADKVLSRDQGQPPGGMPGGGMPPGTDPNGDDPNAPDGPEGDLGVTGHGADGDGSMGSISGSNKGPGLITAEPTAAGLEDRRQRYSRSDADWTDDDEKKHPRANDGKFASKSDAGSGDSGSKSKVKVKVDNFGGKRYYAMADLPGGKQVTHSHEDQHEAKRLAHEEIRQLGHDVEEDEPAKTPAPDGHTFSQTRVEFHSDASAKDENYDVSAANRAYWHGVRQHAASGKPVSQEVQKSFRMTFGDDEAKATFDPKPAADVEQSPQEGARNAEGLVFREGRWHRDEQPVAETKNETIEPEQGLIDSPTASLEGENHVRASNELAGASRPSQGSSESGVDGSVASKPTAVPSAHGDGAGDAGRSRSVPDGHGESGDSGLSSKSGVGDEPARRERVGDGGPTAASGSGDGGGAGRGLGIGGGDGGHRSSDGEAVARTLNASPTVENPTDASAGNWRYHSRDFYKGGIKAKFNNNLEAIRTMRAMADEGRDAATPAEQEVLSRFVGWGAMPGLFNENWDELTAEAFGNKEAGYRSDEYKTWAEEKDKWSEERDSIKPLMTEAEWAAARRATLNSHFTHPSVIDAHWKMAQRMGFKGGRFLEPSAGVGYYIGLMPPELAGKTRVSAIELDPTTGNMLKKLYPKANVEVRGFEKQQSPNDFYNLVASNVPFGDFTVSDPDYDKHNANIHDYFFLKSADLVKPGGMVMHVTSAGTMDKVDPAIRRELARTCDFVAAVRFPGGAHQENAGTEVVTDMVMLRKRHPGEEPVTLEHTPAEAEAKEQGFTGTTTDSLGRVYHWVDGKRVPGPDWLATKDVPDPAGGEPITVNAYFADHPEQILGTLDRTGTMYGGKQKNVSLTEDYEDRLQAAIDRLPTGVFATGTTEKAGAPDRREATAGVKHGGYVIHDGKLFRRDGGSEIEQTVNAKDLERISGQLGVRDAMQAVINAELDGESPDEARARLNSVYDAYVKEHGPLSSKENRKAIATDPDAVRLAALETYNPKDKTAKKADMFSKSTVRSGKRTEHANGVEEGVGVCLNESGSINPERIAELTGKPLAEIEGELRHGGLAFEDPATGWQPASMYLSGNVRQKLVLARAAAAVDAKYQHNVDALENHQPEDIDYQNIDVRAGAAWVPSTDMQEFAASLTGAYSSRIAINYVPQTGQWIVEDTHGKGGSSAGMLEYGTEDIPFTDMLQRVMNSKSLVVNYTALDENGNEVSRIDQDATRQAEDKAKELKSKFNEWVWEDDARRDRLSRFYNDNFNNIIPVHYDGSHLDFPGMNPDFQMRDIQKNFVWQVITTGRGLAAHEVGTGKTASMIAAAMELRRLGLSKKPCIACMKANIDQITMEAQKLYPNARILSTADNFSAKQRKETISRMSTGDYDMVIMTHDHLNMLGMRPEVVKEYVNGQLNELRVAKKAAWAADSSKDNRIVKSLEKAEQRLEARLEKAIKAADKDDAVHFEETGIDQLFVDEAHNYKNLPVYSTGERVKGIPPASTGSDRATNMLMRTEWLMKHNGGRGVVFATGTPVSNTMVELYNIQRYLQPDELKSRGLDTFDAWASTFGDRQTEIEVTPTGGYDQVTRFNKFTNVPELMNMASLVMDVQRADSMKKADGSPVIIRPNRHDKVVVTPLNEMTERMMGDLSARAIACKGKRPEKGADNMAVICADGRKGSVDMRLLYADAPDDPNSKLNKCVQNVLQLHNERPTVTQAIFSNVGVNPSKKTGFHVYGDIIEKLVAGGIPRERIADFSQLEDDKRHDAEVGMRNGEILVGIGSTEKLGTGVNVQQKLAALHHLDVPWKPSEIEQRDGRGWRHGNLNDPSQTMPNPRFDASRPEGPDNRKDVVDPSKQHVAIHRYVSEGSLDQFMWQTVGAKAAFINQTINAKDRKTRSVSDDDTETLTPEQFMAVASGNPEILKKISLQSDIRELKVGHDQHRRDQIKLKENIKHHEEHIVPEAEGIAARYRTDSTHLAAQKPADGAKSEFAAKLGETVHAKRSDADNDLESRLKSDEHVNWNAPDFTQVGEYRGFKLQRPKHGSTEMRFPDGAVYPTKLVIEGPSGASYPVRTATFAGIDATMRGIQKQSEDKALAVEQLHRDMGLMRGRAGKGYHRAAELADKQAALKILDKELKGSETDEKAFGSSQHDIAAESPPAGAGRTKFHPVTAKWLADAASPEEMTESLHHGGVYSNRSVAIKVPEAMKRVLMEKHPYYAKLATEQTEPSKHANKVHDLMMSPAQASPMKFVADRTKTKQEGWGSRKKDIADNHAIFEKADGQYAALDGEYVSTFQHLYPNATFHAPIDSKHPVVVKNGEDVVGILPERNYPQYEMSDHVRNIKAAKVSHDAEIDETESPDEPATDEAARYSRRMDQARQQQLDLKSRISTAIAKRLANLKG